jgi:hypothetical protein
MPGHDFSEHITLGLDAWLNAMKDNGHGGWNGGSKKTPSCGQSDVNECLLGSATDLVVVDRVLASHLLTQQQLDRLGTSQRTVEDLRPVGRAIYAAYESKTKDCVQSEWVAVVWVGECGGDRMLGRLGARAKCVGATVRYVKCLLDVYASRHYCMQVVGPMLHDVMAAAWCSGHK